MRKSPGRVSRQPRFALRGARHRLLGLHTTAAQFQGLNQFYLVLLAPPLAGRCGHVARSRRGDFTMAVKHTDGPPAVGFFLYAAGGIGAAGGAVSPW